MFLELKDFPEVEQDSIWNLLLKMEGKCSFILL